MHSSNRSSHDNYVSLPHFFVPSHNGSKAKRQCSSQHHQEEGCNRHLSHSLLRALHFFSKVTLKRSLAVGKKKRS